MPNSQHHPARELALNFSHQNHLLLRKMQAKKQEKQKKKRLLTLTALAMPWLLTTEGREEVGENVTGGDR